jgi:hypothetical protein
VDEKGPVKFEKRYPIHRPPPRSRGPGNQALDP